MRRSMVILNLALLVTGGFIVYRLGGEWKNYGSRVSWVYQGRAVEAAENLAPGQPRPAVANWGDIVARSVFHPDRTSTVATAAGGPPPPEPILFGTMNLGSGPVALMSEVPGRGFRQVRLGESIGGYKLVAVDGQKVSLEWPGGHIKLDAAESASRVSAPSGPTTIPAPSSARPTPGGATVVSPTASPASAATKPSGGGTIFEQYPALRSIATPQQVVDLEREPPGTIRDGKRKQISATPFGLQIYWEDLKGGEGKKEEKR